MSRKHPAVRPLGIGVCLLTAAATALPLSTASAALPSAPTLPALGDTVDALAKTLDTRAVKDAVVPTTAARTAASARAIASVVDARTSNSRTASDGTTLGRVPPRSTPTLTDTPASGPSRPVMAWRAMVR